MTDAADRIQTLSSLYTALVDSRHGNEGALEDADGQGLSGLFRGMIDVRQGDADEVARELKALGAQRDQHGSFMSTVHRTVIKVRSLVSDIDRSILPSLIDGEERILGYHNDAIGAVGAPHQRILLAQRQRLEQEIAEMRSFQKS
jgi:uncharacterized protein (TIGR02284 family)